MSDAFFQRELIAPDEATGERWLAEAFAAGVAGCEERPGEGEGKRYLLYVPQAVVGAVEEALRGAGAPPGTAEAIVERAWDEAWREGLTAIEISPRLVVRPDFVAHEPAPGQATVVIEPGQAFGTGGHESTRLALELVDAWLPRVARGGRVLDVGTGSGVLAIAGAKLGAAHAVGFDLDPLAGEAARANAVANGVDGRTTFFTGGIDALVEDGFALVVANMLRSEVEPILGDVAARVAESGVGIFTGLLRADRQRMEAGLAAAGLRVVDARELADADGEFWLGLVAQR